MYSSGYPPGSGVRNRFPQKTLSESLDESDQFQFESKLPSIKNPQQRQHSSVTKSPGNKAVSDMNMDMDLKQQLAACQKQLRATEKHLAVAVAARDRVKLAATFSWSLVNVGIFALLMLGLLFLGIPTGPSTTPTTTTITTEKNNTSSLLCRPVNFSISHHTDVITTPEQLVNLTRAWIGAADTLSSLPYYHSNKNDDDMERPSWAELYLPDIASLCSTLLASQVHQHVHVHVNDNDNGDSSSDAEKTKHVAHICAALEFHLANADATFAVLAPTIRPWPRNAVGYLDFLENQVHELSLQKDSMSETDNNLFFSPPGYASRNGHAPREIASRPLVEGFDGNDKVSACFPTTDTDGLQFSTHLRPAGVIDPEALSVRKLFAASTHPWRFGVAANADRVLVSSADHSLFRKLGLHLDSLDLGLGQVAAVEKALAAHIRHHDFPIPMSDYFSTGPWQGRGSLGDLVYSLAVVSEGIKELLVLGYQTRDLSHIPSGILGVSASLQNQTTAALTALLSLRAAEMQADTLSAQQKDFKFRRENSDQQGWVTLRIVRPGIARLHLSPHAEITHHRYAHPTDIEKVFASSQIAAQALADSQRVKNLGTVVDGPKLRRRKISFSSPSSGAETKEREEAFLNKWLYHFHLDLSSILAASLSLDKNTPLQQVRVQAQAQVMTPLGLVNWTIHHHLSEHETKKVTRKEMEEVLEDFDKLFE